jgi:hypothetical protein
VGGVLYESVGKNLAESQRQLQVRVGSAGAGGPTHSEVRCHAQVRLRFGDFRCERVAHVSCFGDAGDQSH